MEPRITLSDIGRRLGLGKSTVQRALSNDPGCSPETAELVRRTAAELGYRPDPIFAALAARRVRRGGSGIPLVHLVDERAKGNKPSGHYAEHLAERAQELGYGLERINLGTWASPRRLWKILFARGVAGVIADSLRAHRAELLAANTLFPLVCVGRTDPMPFNTIRPSIVHPVHEMWTRMNALGYRRIGAAILSHDPMVEDDFSRFAAALACQALDSRGDAVAIPPLRTSIHAASEIAGWAKRHRPDAVIGFHVGQYYDLLDAGLKVPEELGFACLHLDEVPREPEYAGLFAGMAQDFPLIARSAVNLLDQMVRHGERGVPRKPINLTVHAEWREGRTLPPRVEPRPAVRHRRAAAPTSS